MKSRLSKFFVLSALLTCSLAIGCSSEGDTTSTASTGTANQNGAPAQVGAVVNRIEQSGVVSYKIYLQPEANGSNRKGIVLLGSGNDGTNPSTGSLEGGLENNTANELAKLGYVAAIVAYRDQPALVPNDNGASWDKNSEMLASDMSDVANHIIATYGSGLTRARVVTAGVSYTSYSLLTNLAISNTLADTRGFLATCGATDKFQAENLRLPIFSLVCSGNPDGNYSGEALYNLVQGSINVSAQVKADSGFFTDPCPGVPADQRHCGGDTNTWTAKLIERVQIWLP